jgi:tetratricopeptide (TPR) repeat protein
MNKILVTFAVALAMSGVAQGEPQGGAQKEIVIKDKAERDAYRAVLNIADAGSRGAAMEAFIKQYPRSAAYGEVLEQAWAAYVEAGNAAKADEMARQVIVVNPDNVDMLAIVCGSDRHNAAQGSADAIKAAGEDCAKGLQALSKWQKPDDMIDEQFKLERDKKSQIFNGGLGFAALQRKDYTAAREFYLKALQVDTYDINNNYQLAITDFSMEPMDPNGLWYAVRASNQMTGLGNPGADKVLAFAKDKYVKYHGSEDGWFQFLAAVASQTAPPNPLGVKPASPR